MESTEILKKLRRIELRTKNLSTQLFSGDYSSVFRGKGMTFNSVRAYTYGDDVRNIDWNVTARTGHPYVKIFEEERELSLMFLIDVSGSTFFGTQRQFKIDLMTEICATLAFSAALNNDKTGAIFYGAALEKYIPLKKGRDNILRFIQTFLSLQTANVETNLEKSITYLNSMLKNRSIVFIISDFINDGYAKALQQCASKHDVICISISDKTDRALPFIGKINVTDAETGKTFKINTNDSAVTNTFTRYYGERQNYLDQAVKSAGASLIFLDTTDDYVKTLQQFFNNRRNRR